MYLIFTSSFLFLFASALNAFDINLSARQFSNFGSGKLIGDLVVGDSAYVKSYHFCRKDEKLVLKKNFQTTHRSKFLPVFLITVEPRNQVEVILLPRKGEMDFRMDKHLITDVIPKIRPCYNGKASFVDHSEYFYIKSIAGRSNMRDYLNFLLEHGFLLDL